MNEKQAWFGGALRVRCPGCGQRAVVRPDVGELRCSCVGCGRLLRLDEWVAGRPLYFDAALRVAADHGLELWYTANFRGHALWTLDEVHLDYMVRFVASQHRSTEFPSAPGARQLADKFPAWLTSHKNRDDVVRVLRRMASQ